MLTTHPQSNSIAPDACEIDVAGSSDIGKKRRRNEDRFLTADLKRMLSIRESNVPHDDCDRLCSGRTGYLLVVADGMGGHQSGDVASSTAVQVCAHYVLDMMHWFLRLSESEENDFLEELSDCLKVAQKRLWTKSGGDHSRMGTTVTIAYVLWPRMYVVHAGDSRCYLIRDGQMRQITTDHTLAQQMVDQGAMSAEDAESSRWRHVLWNCVGGGDKTVQPEVSKVLLTDDDVVLLCSDGVTGMIDDETIQQTLEAQRSSADAVRELIEQSNAAGGRDNITAIVARFSESNVATNAAAPDDSCLDTTIDGNRA